MSEDTFYQEPEDQLLLISEGKYKGHEGIVRRMKDGTMSILVLEKNAPKEGKAKVIDIISVEETNILDPQLH